MKFSLPDPFEDFTKPISLRMAEGLVITVWVMFGWFGTFLGLASMLNAFGIQLGVWIIFALTTILTLVAIYGSVKFLQRLWGWSK